MLAKQGEKLTRMQSPDIRAKVLDKVADFLATGHTPNVRDLERYLRKSAVGF